MKSKTVKRLATLFVAGTMFVCLPMTALAERELSIADADGYIITVTRDGDRIMYSVNSGAASDESIVIYGTGSNKFVIINFSDSSGVDASITLKNLSINNRNTNFAPVDTSGIGNLTINLDGNNQLIAADEKAAVQTEHTGSLTIQEKAGSTGKLVVQGGVNGAGIGGGNGGNGHDIIIKSGTVEATGGNDAAGIGGGNHGSGYDITIKGGTVTAKAGEGGGAGIGGGYQGAGSNITIEGGTITAIGGGSGAGIGGGHQGAGENITIKGGTVTAKGGEAAAGIGSGFNQNNASVIITESAVVYAAGGKSGTILEQLSVPELALITLAFITEPNWTST